MNVLITGGTGSLGHALCRHFRDTAQITTLSRNEAKVEQMRRDFPGVDCRIGDVRDIEALRQACYGQDLVIHAGALKVVPLAEAQPSEALNINAVGSMNVARVCGELGVKTCALISTDKACSSATFYGTSKRLAEGVFREASRTYANTRFVTCRYGNVIGSTGSIAPFFRRLHAEGKPLTITDMQSTRFWLTMPQAVELVLHAIATGPSGSIVVPKAQASLVTAFALALCPGATLTSIGLRPGERLHEALLIEEELRNTEEQPHHFIVHRDPVTEPVARIYTSTAAAQLDDAALKQMIEVAQC